MLRARSRQRDRARASELARPVLTTPEEARASGSEGTSYRRLQPTFFRCQRRVASVASRVATGFLRELSPARSPVECLVSRRAHPASAGPFIMRPSVFFSLRTRGTVPLTPRHLPGLRASSGSSTGSTELASTAPPCSTCGLSRARTSSTSETLRERAARHPSHAFHDSNRARRALFAHDLSCARRSRSSVTLFTSPSLHRQASPASFCSLSHDPRPLPRNPIGPRHLHDGRSKTRLRRDRPRQAPSNEVASFCPAEPRTPEPPVHPSSPARVTSSMGNTVEIDPRSGLGPFLRAAPREEDATSRNQVLSPTSPRARRAP